MTDVLSRDAEAPQAPAAPTAETPQPVGDWSGTRGAGVDLSDVAALALAAVTATAAIGLGRLFKDGSFVPPVLVTVAATHGIALLARRLRLGLGVTMLLSVAALVAIVVWVVEPHTTSGGLPQGATWHAITHDLSRAWQRFGEVIAPAPVTRGFVLSAVIGTWAAAVAADSAAFRLGAPFEATIPSFTLFVFGAVLGADRHRVGYTVVYFAALLLFLLVHGSVRRSEQLSWFAGRTRGGARAIVQGGLALVAVAVVAAMVLGPGLPGAKSDAMISWRPQKDSGPSDRKTVSPLVDIRTRIVDQSEREVFTVVSNVQDYWRLTALEKFDGQIWSSVGTYKPAKQKLPAGEGKKAGRRPVQQRFTITGLSSIWLPAVYEPQELANPKGVRYDSESASLLAEAETSDGLTYQLTSGQPNLRAEQLATASVVVPRDIADRYLPLPDDFPRSVSALAAQATGLNRARCARPTCTAAELNAQGLGPYKRALALQDFLRTNYTYDLKVPPGHDVPALERFLFQVKRGYCEQFAGAYAAMARAAGLPSRVAVGFREGTLVAPNSYRVRGKNAHAWPEVYLGEYGWVAFEPTPPFGRNEQYTGTHDPGPDVDRETGPTPVADTATPSTTPSSTTSTTTPPAPIQKQHAFPWRRVLLVGVLLLGLAVLIGAVPAAHALRRQRRRSAAVTPAARVLLAWTEAVERLATVGHPKHRWETAAEYVRRASRATPKSADPLAVLAEETSAVTFAEIEPSGDAARRAEQAAAAVEADVRAAATFGQRMRWALDPRPLFNREA